MRALLLGLAIVLLFCGLFDAVQAQTANPVYFYLKISFETCPKPADFIESLDDPSIYQVTWEPKGNCSKKRASDSVLTLASRLATSEEQRNSLEAAQDSARATAGVVKASIVNGPNTTKKADRYPTWSAVVMIILMYVHCLRLI